MSGAVNLQENSRQQSGRSAKVAGRPVDFDTAEELSVDPEASV